MSSSSYPALPDKHMTFRLMRYAIPAMQRHLEQKGLKKGLEKGLERGLQQRRQVAMKEVAVKMLAEGRKLAR